MTSFTLDTNCFYAVVNGEMVARSSLPLTAIFTRRQKSLRLSLWERGRFAARWMRWRSFE